MVLDPYDFDHTIPLVDDEDTGVDFMAAPKPLPPIPTKRAVRHGDHDQSTHGNREGGAEPEAKGGATGGSSVLPYGERSGSLTIRPIYTSAEKAATSAKLATAPIAINEASYNPDAGSTPSHVVTLDDGSQALVKPDSWDSAETPGGIRSEYMTEDASSAVREMASQAVADAIGVPFPAVVMREDIKVWDPDHGQIEPTTTVQHYVDGEPLAYHGGMNSNQMHMIGLFDSITGNTDRHPGNIIMQPDGNAVPIDHNLTFPNRVGESMTDPGGGRLNGNFIMLQGDPLTDGDREILAEMQGNNELKAQLTDLVGPRAVELMDKRIEYMQMNDRQLTHRDMSTEFGVAIMYGEEPEPREGEFYEEAEEAEMEGFR